MRDHYIIVFAFRLTDLGRTPEDEFGSSFLSVTLATNALTASVMSLK